MARLYEELIQTIEHRKTGGDKTTFEVRISMLEIYNEVVRDLLNKETWASNGKKKGLKVREHPSKGFYGKFWVASVVIIDCVNEMVS